MMKKAIKKVVKKAMAAFTLVEIMVVVAIIGLLASLILPLILGSLENARRAEVLDDVSRLTAIWDQIKLESGNVPTQQIDSNLSYDISGVTPGIMNTIVERHDFAVPMDRINESNHYIDLWNDPIKYVKGDYANRIDKKLRNPKVDRPQDTNKPIGDPTSDIAAESDWNAANIGGYSYIWSYGGVMEDQSEWLYKK